MFASAQNARRSTSTIGATCLHEHCHAATPRPAPPALPTATAPAKPPVPAPVAATPAKSATPAAAAVKPQAAPALDLKTLESRLKQTPAIGVFT
jgi:hypothetical protein